MGGGQRDQKGGEGPTGLKGGWTNGTRRMGGQRDQKGGGPTGPEGWGVGGQGDLKDGGPPA